MLIFFWGAFALIAAAARRAPWSWSPLIAIFIYGWTFEMGLMNYYISLGLSCFALAAFWRSTGPRRLIPFLSCPLIWMAHPLGIVWLLGSAGYIFLADRKGGRQHWYLLAVTGILLILVRLFLAGNYQVEWPDKPIFLYNGADQLVLFGSRYYLPAGLLIFFALAALAIDVSSGERSTEFGAAHRLPVELYVVAGMASMLLPSSVAFPKFHAPVSLLTQRLSLVSGILACCALATMKPRRWHWIAASLISAIFFTFLYQDTGIVNQMEEQVERVVAALPTGSQVVSAIGPPAGSRIVIQHIVDRACIGHCFSFGNFEPSTGQFRVRALPGNAIVAAAAPNSSVDPINASRVQSLAPRAFEIYPCGTGMTNVCVRELSGGLPGI